MKKFARTIQGLLVLSIASFVLVAATASRFVHIKNEQLSAAAFLAQTTATAATSGASEIGSTDGIVLAGVIILMIIVAPILMRRKSWSEN